ncbi:transcription factor SPT20 homolog [Cavia porcellus]|uniref:transcription factor SPT20 homolog n=1 Tax=Cavia porcellus TaxID=10141 RepID=UPI002FE20B99
MQRGLEQALDRADEVIAGAQQRPPARRVPWAEGKSLHEKLYDIYVEECGKEPEVTEELTASVHLLEKLVSRESLPCLVFNLYPGDKGYSVMLDDKSGSFVETISLPYEESKLLEYLDARQLPPVLLDILDTSQINVFHSGCVIAEIRDYRQCVGLAPSVYKSRHILLHPTMQTLVCDAEAIARENPRWTQKDKPPLGSRRTLSRSEPMCLNPSVAVACTANRLQCSMGKRNTAPMQQCFKRPLSPNLSLLHELSQCAPPPDFRVLTMCKEIKQEDEGQGHNLRITTQNYTDTWRQRPCDLTVPSEIDVQKHAKGKKGPLPGDVPRHCWPPLVLEYDCLFEFEPEIQPWETDPSTVLKKGDLLWCDMIDPPKFPTNMIPNHPTQVSTGDHSGGLTARSKTDAGKAVSTCQVSIQSKAECSRRIAPGSSASASVGQPPEAKPILPVTSVSKKSSVSKTKVNPEVPLTTLTSRSQQCSVQHPSALQVRSPWVFPPLAPGPKADSLFQECPMGLRGVTSLPPPAQSLAGPSEGTLKTQNSATSTSLEVVSGVGLAQGASGLMSGSEPTLGNSSDVFDIGKLPLRALMGPQGLKLYIHRSFSPNSSSNLSPNPKSNPSPSSNPNPNPSPNPNSNPISSSNPNPRINPNSNPSFNPNSSPNPSPSSNPSFNPNSSPNPNSNPTPSPNFRPNPNSSPSPNSNPSLSSNPGPNPNSSPSPNPGPIVSVDGQLQQPTAFPPQPSPQAFVRDLSSQ